MSDPLVDNFFISNKQKEEKPKKKKANTSNKFTGSKNHVQFDAIIEGTLGRKVPVGIDAKDKEVLNKFQQRKQLDAVQQQDAQKVAGSKGGNRRRRPGDLAIPRRGGPGGPGGRGPGGGGPGGLDDAPDQGGRPQGDLDGGGSDMEEQKYEGELDQSIDQEQIEREQKKDRRFRDKIAYESGHHFGIGEGFDKSQKMKKFIKRNVNHPDDMIRYGFDNMQKLGAEMDEDERRPYEKFMKEKQEDMEQQKNSELQKRTLEVMNDKTTKKVDQLTEILKSHEIEPKGKKPELSQSYAKKERQIIEDQINPLLRSHVKLKKMHESLNQEIMIKDEEYRKQIEQKEQELKDQKKKLEQYQLQEKNKDDKYREQIKQQQQQIREGQQILQQLQLSHLKTKTNEKLQEDEIQEYLKIQKRLQEEREYLAEQLQKQEQQIQLLEMYQEDKDRQLKDRDQIIMDEEQKNKQLIEQLLKINEQKLQESTKILNRSRQQYDDDEEESKDIDQERKQQNQEQVDQLRQLEVPAVSEFLQPQRPNHLKEISQELIELSNDIIRSKKDFDIDEERKQFQQLINDGRKYYAKDSDIRKELKDISQIEDNKQFKQSLISLSQSLYREVHDEQVMENVEQFMGTLSPFNSNVQSFNPTESREKQALKDGQLEMQRYRDYIEGENDEAMNSYYDGVMTAKNYKDFKIHLDHLTAEIRQRLKKSLSDVISPQRKNDDDYGDDDDDEDDQGLGGGGKEKKSNIFQEVNISDKKEEGEQQQQQQQQQQQTKQNKNNNSINFSKPTESIDLPSESVDLISMSQSFINNQQFQNKLSQIKPQYQNLVESIYEIAVDSKLIGNNDMLKSSIILLDSEFGVKSEDFGLNSVSKINVPIVNKKSVKNGINYIKNELKEIKQDKYLDRFEETKVPLEEFYDNMIKMENERKNRSVSEIMESKLQDQINISILKNSFQKSSIIKKNSDIVDISKLNLMLKSKSQDSLINLKVDQEQALLKKMHQQFYADEKKQSKLQKSIDSLSSKLSSILSQKKPSKSKKITPLISKIKSQIKEQVKLRQSQIDVILQDESTIHFDSDDSLMSMSISADNDIRRQKRDDKKKESVKKQTKKTLTDEQYARYLNENNTPTRRQKKSRITNTDKSSYNDFLDSMYNPY